MSEIEQKENHHKAIVFDMDGVLFDTERLATKAWLETALQMNVGNIDEAVSKCVGLNSKDTRAMFTELYGSQFPYDEFRSKSSEYYHTMLQQGVPVKLGVMELLGYLKENGYGIALATSTSKASAISHLKDAGIHEYFEVIVTGDMVERGKPDPQIYQMACEGLGVLPTDCIAIEDSPNGIRSAFGAGMKPIMVPDLIEPTEELKALTFLILASLLEVRDYLEQVQAI